MAYNLCLLPRKQGSVVKLIYLNISFVVHMYGLNIIPKPQKEDAGQLGYQNEVIQ